jgi:phosphopantothenoylcysteine decarboxylase/phosphopantothenate--cysteine ligase
MHLLITAGPTREYIDDVRFLSNASSGRMGYALADAAQRRGWLVTIVSGPVAIQPPANVAVRAVTSARDMLAACLDVMPTVDGVIAVAAVADYRPKERFAGKLHRTTEPLQLELVPNPDILAELCLRKDRQWAVAFAVESSASGTAAGALVERARAKLAAKNCDAIVVNASSAMESAETRIQLLDRSGRLALEFDGPKNIAAERIIDWIANHLIASATKNF